MTIVPILVFIIVLIIRMLFLSAIFFLIVTLVSGRSQVIDLRGSYNDSCRRQQFRWSLVETWRRLSKHGTLHMTIHIHVPKEKRIMLKPYGNKDTFARYTVYHMDIDCKENNSPKMII
jgi:hypothetical protein